MNAPTPESQDAPREGERIAKLLARAGIASRREVERMIADGRVKLNDEVITTPATVLRSLKGVSVDGKPVKAAEPTRLFVFHKPGGLITAERDPAGRPTIYTALRNALPEGAGRVMPVGRLDYNTEGLLLLTNDGELKRAMELPATGLPRTYRARTFGDITQAQLEELIEGVTIDGVRYGRIDANMERRTGRNQWIEVTITEGKNREVRRVLEYLGLEVSRLLRIAYGPFQLLDLPRGQALEIRQVDVERFRKGLLGEGSREAFVPRTAPQQARARIARSGSRSESRPEGRRSDGPRSEGPRSEGPRGKSSARPPARRVPAGKPPAGKVDTRPARERAPVEGKLSVRTPRSAGSRDADARPARPQGNQPRGRNADARSADRRGSDGRGQDKRGPDKRGPDKRGPQGRGPEGRGRPGPRR